ncbi:MAG: phosphate ABC transporter permease PstA [Actinomycetota bacterium]|nr:phosphate ABC transporter permease PstA [Actinomycetota bacterium]
MSNIVMDKPGSLSSARLPRWSPWAIAIGSVAAGCAIGLGAGLDSRIQWGLIAALLFVLGTFALATKVEGRRQAKDRVATSVVWVAFLLAVIPLASLVWETVRRGVKVFDVYFLTHSMGVVADTDTGGGIYHAIIGTLEQVGLATLIALPIGLLTAIYLVEYGRGKLAKAVTFFVDVMTGIPSIVAGLFAYALFALILGPGVRFGFVGAVALTVLMIPIVVRSTEEMLKIVPNELREASFALGVPKWRTILKVVIPTTAGGIATGVMLAIARVIGETAPLLVTVGFATGVNLNPFEDRIATLPVFAYSSYQSPGFPPEPSVDRAWAAALVLMLIVMLLNVVARIISRLFAPKTR